MYDSIGNLFTHIRYFFIAITPKVDDYIIKLKMNLKFMNSLNKINLWGIL
jgi:hypothetical protein